VIGAGAGGACAAVLSVGWVCVGVSERLRRAVCGSRGQARGVAVVLVIAGLRNYWFPLFIKRSRL
jgi:hypothetical protein